VGNFEHLTKAKESALVRFLLAFPSRLWFDDRQLQLALLKRSYRFMEVS
jgi:hypothetical protein